MAETMGGGGSTSKPKKVVKNQSGGAKQSGGTVNIGSGNTKDMSVKADNAGQVKQKVNINAGPKVIKTATTRDGGKAKRR